ncbi:MAG: hypothetical protein J1F18_05515 [Lachnospiraceae bacterium]|nr:hypothetical protein [Lachnospiraceae bacterium]
MRMSEMQRCNKVTMLCHGIIGAIISAAYVIEVLKGSRTILYLAMLVLLAVGPVIVEVAIYKKNPESDILRKVIAYSYAVMYAVVVFTTTSKLPFTYIVPMLIIITLYGDISYCLKVGVGGVLVNVADVIYKALDTGIARADLPDIEIRLIVMVIIVVYLCLTAKVLKQINEDKQQVLETEKEKVEQLLNHIMHLSGELSGGVEQVDNHMSRLDKSVEEMSVAMEEVASGTQETAESVQNQLSRTQEIQKLIDEVGEVGIFIKERMDAATGEMESGVADMELLSKQSKQSRKANETVVSLMGELHTQAEKMNEIIGLINSIANRTSMLALNASIEAARAGGEAGASFSVVAKQVTDLADQTKVATVNIAELIGTVTDELNQVTDAVKVLEENTEAQDEKTENLNRSLNGIMEMTTTIAEKSTGLEKMIGKLSAANGDIVQNIQVISAITEEVTAHSSETLNSCKENQAIVDNVSQITAKLNQDAKELKSGQM